MPRTPDQIEAAAEGRMDLIDRQLLIGRLTQAEYDDAAKRLDRWTRRQYEMHASARRRSSWRGTADASHFAAVAARMMAEG